MNTGVLGGTFDPVHNGHIMVAEEARARLNLAEVLFVPAGQPWLRGDSPISAAEHRVQMVRLAIAACPYFRLSTVEIERAGPSYTVDTITELQAQLGAGDELFFILGWDSLAQLPQWREPLRLITMCRLVAVPRPGYPRPDLKALEVSIPGLSQMEYRNEFGQELRKLREAVQYTQDQLAKLTGISAAYVSQLETGRKKPTDRVIAKLSGSLGVRENLLFIKIGKVKMDLAAILLDKPEVDISATEIRNRVARGLSIDHLVPEPVNEYIKKHKLYLTQ